MARWQLWSLIAGLFVLGFSTLASAESYVAVGGGLNFAELDSTDAGTIRLKQNGFFGAKFGHYLNDRQFNWLGFEMDLYRAAPSIKQQTVNGSTNQALGGSTGNQPPTVTASGPGCSQATSTSSNPIQDSASGSTSAIFQRVASSPKRPLPRASISWRVPATT